MPYGEYTFKDNEVRVRLEPMAAVMFKRIFERVYKNPRKWIEMSANDLNARQLVWFMDMYPLTPVKPEDEWRLMGLAAENQRKREALVAITGGDYEAPQVDLALPPRPYQLVPAAMMNITGGVLCGDQMGLGKTISAIVAIAQPGSLPALVVTTTEVPRQFQLEIERFAPNLSTWVLGRGSPLKQGQPADLALHILNGGTMPDVVITSYSKIAGWSEWLIEYFKPKLAIFDECQEFRTGFDTARGAAGKYISENVVRRLGTSGTPIHNYGVETWPVMEILAPGCLGTLGEFKREWCNNKGIVKESKALGGHLRDMGVYISRTREQVGRELPPLTIAPHYCPSDKTVLDRLLHDTRAIELAKFILSSDRNAAFQAAGQFDILMRQQTGIAKAPYVAAHVGMLLESGQRVVLAGWHLAVYEIWRDLLKDYDPAFYTGEQSSKQKSESLRRFKEKETGLLILSLRAGRGIDGLQYADCYNAVFGELDWSPAVHEQCLSADTEVLTPRGFLGIDDISVGDLIAGFDSTNGKINWVTASKKTDRLLGYNEKMYGVKTKKIDLRVTGEHRMVVRKKRRFLNGSTGRSNWEFETAESLAVKARRFIPINGLQDGLGVPLNEHQLKLIGWFISDGSFNGKYLHIYQAAHQPWNSDLINTLDHCNIKWSRFQRRVKSGTLMNMYIISKGVLDHWSISELKNLNRCMKSGMSPKNIANEINRSLLAISTKIRKILAGNTAPGSRHEPGKTGWIDIEGYLDKNLSPLFDNITREQLLHLIHGINMGDGSKNSTDTMRITSTNKLFLDRLQSLCVRRGLSANISTRSSRTKANNLAYDIYISLNQEAIIPRYGRDNAFCVVPSFPGERVWCLTNELQTLVVRRNGKVSIVGNCAARLHRDGIDDAVTAWFMIADSGSDPIMAERLGIKRGQLEGIRDPDGDIVSGQTDPDVIKRLAEDFLARVAKRGERAT